MDSRPKKPTLYEQEEVARRLAALFAAADAVPGHVADYIGLDRSSMTKVLAGNKPLKPEFAVQIADMFDVSLEFIYRGRLVGLPETLSSKIITSLSN